MIPNGIEEIIKVYGDPNDPAFVEENMIKRKLPFPLRVSSGGVSYNIYGHKLVVPLIIEFFEEVAQAYGGYDKLKEAGLDIWDGCYCKRSKRGTNMPSTHSWGIAFDYLPHLGPWGKPSEIPEEIITIARRLGFVNGRYWKPADGMHFQYCRGY